jgi:hypothetical protein
MRKVVDANFLRHQALVEYLGENPTNHVAFTDYACMECYKGNATANLTRSLDIVSRYPDQVIILKGTRDVIRLQAESHATGDDLVDLQQTAEFRGFCVDVRHALDGDRALMSQLLRLGRMANAHFDQMRMDAPGVAAAIQQMALSFSHDQLAELRSRGTLSKATGDLIVRNILHLAALLFKAHPDVSSPPGVETVRDTFVFRFALAAQLLVVRWLTDGGVEGVGIERLRNDVVDVTCVAYATLFDGILSNDRKLLDIYAEATFFLQRVFT